MTGVALGRLRSLLDYLGSAEECEDCHECAASDEAPCALHALVADLLVELPAYAPPCA